MKKMMMPLFGIILIIGLLILNNINKTSAKVIFNDDMKMKFGSEITEKKAPLTENYFENYPMNDIWYAKPWRDVQVHMETKLILAINPGSIIKDTLAYGFPIKHKKSRLAITCPLFILNCNDGFFIIKSGGRIKRYCDDIAPINVVSVSNYMYVKFEGNGGPYQVQIACIITGIHDYTASIARIFNKLKDKTSCPNPVPPPKDYAEERGCDCGSENGMEPGAERAIGGSAAGAHSHPWMVLIHGESSNVHQFHCAGVLISSEWLLTAFSGLQNLVPDNLKASLGNHITTDPSTGLSYQVIEVINIGNYNAFSRQGDLAMVKIEGPVQFNWKVRPICLPNPCINYEGKRGIIAGWGKTDSDDDVSDVSDVLHEVNVPILYNSNCKDNHTFLADTMICAGSSSRSGCIQDMGTPLWYFNSKGRAELIGIHFYGDGCNSDDPSVYIKILDYIDEIINKISNTPNAAVCRSAIHGK